MNIAVPKENSEKRIPLLPDSVKKITSQNINVFVENNLGSAGHFTNENYEQAGAKIVSSKDLFSHADIIVKVTRPSPNEMEKMKPGSFYLGHLDPFNNKDLLKQLAEYKINAFSVEMIPRTTKAQKMDVLSSQASLAGYRAVILAAEKATHVFPMMTTPAGTLSPAKVFVIGAGVAGLQAIATARRLGAIVQAFDTRTEVEEQIQSLGAKFVKVELGDTGKTKDGYAKELSQEQLDKQRETMTKYCIAADVVITTAQVFGREAPRIITKDMLDHMKPGSIIIDLAASTGGNVEGSVCGEEVLRKGVSIIGPSNPAADLSLHASQMYSSNITNFILEFWGENKNLNLEDEIIKNCLITHNGHIVQKRFE